MPKRKWFYYLHQEGNAMLQINTDGFDLRLNEIGFQRCTKEEYIKAQYTRRGIVMEEEEANDGNEE